MGDPTTDDAPDLSFLHKFRVGQGRLILHAADRSRHVFEHLDLNLIQNKCPVLALSFESSANRATTADLEVPSIAAGICLVRFMYTENYAALPQREYDLSMLLTAQVTMLASFLDYTELYLAANSSLLAKIDFAASFPSAPYDLYETIRFLWPKNFGANVKESLLNYCVAAFKQHGLGSQPEFLKLSEEHLDFHMGLSRVNRERGYDEPAILHLPGPNRKTLCPVEDDLSGACGFSDDAGDIIWGNESDDSDEEQLGDSDEEQLDGNNRARLADDDEYQPTDKTRPLFLELPVRPKRTQQTGPDMASLSSSPTRPGSFIVIEDPFKSTFDSDSESGWEVVE